MYHAYVNSIRGNLGGTITDGLKFIHADRCISKSSTVFVKPNLGFPVHSHGVTTSPEFLRVLLKVLKEKAGRVIVGESDGGNHSYTAEDAFKNHGMYEICREVGVELVNLSRLPSVTLGGKILGKKVKVKVPWLLLEGIDCFISVPVMKVHSMTTVSLSLKNLWGCYTDTMRCVKHQNIGHKLALMANAFKPMLAVIDGTWALDKHAPLYGEPVNTNLVIMADNPLVADCVGAAVMGFAPVGIRHISICNKANIDPYRHEKVTAYVSYGEYQRHFTNTRTLADWLAVPLFHCDWLARLVMQSPLTPLFYGLAKFIRCPEEKRITEILGGYKRAVR